LKKTKKELCPIPNEMIYNLILVIRRSNSEITMMENKEISINNKMARVGNILIIIEMIIINNMIWTCLFKKILID